MNNPDKLNQSLTDACVLIGLTPPFDGAKAKSRYRELAKLYHPDVGVIKDSARFAEISRAYELIESNISRLSALRLNLASQSDAHSSKLNNLLQELHQAKIQTVTAESHARQMADEAEALRRYYSATRDHSKRSLLLSLVWSTGALLIGFLAGSYWSYRNPVISLVSTPKYARTVLTTDTSTSFSGSLNVPHTTAPLTLTVVPIEVEVSYPEGEAVFEHGKATVTTTPSVVLLKPLEMLVTGQESGDNSQIIEFQPSP